MLVNVEILVLIKSGKLFELFKTNFLSLKTEFLIKAVYFYNLKLFPKIYSLKRLFRRFSHKPVHKQIV